MRLKFTLSRGDSAVDLVAVVDATVTVGELADRIAASDPVGNAQSTVGLSLAVHGNHRRMLPTGATLADADLRSGVKLSLAKDSGADGGAQATAAGAVALIVGGPDTGKEFPIPTGASYVGRDSSCEVNLSDPLVSRQHAKLLISDVVEIVDLGSANGVSIGGVLTPRALLRPRDVVEVGDSELSIRLLSPESTSAESGHLDFNRSPRLAPRFVGKQFETPEAPSRLQRRRLPMIPLPRPLLMGGVLYAITHSYTSLIFVALSPVMMLGNAAEAIIFGRRDYRNEVEQYRADLADLTRRPRRRERTSRRPD